MADAGCEREKVLFSSVDVTTILFNSFRFLMVEAEFHFFAGAPFKMNA